VVSTLFWDNSRSRPVTGVCAVFLFAILFGVFTTLVVPILAIVALVRTGRLTRQLAELKGEIG